MFNLMNFLPYKKCLSGHTCQIYREWNKKSQQYKVVQSCQQGGESINVNIVIVFDDGQNNRT